MATWGKYKTSCVRNRGIIITILISSSLLVISITDVSMVLRDTAECTADVKEKPTYDCGQLFFIAFRLDPGSLCVANIWHRIWYLLWPRNRRNSASSNKTGVEGR